MSLRWEDDYNRRTMCRLNGRLAPGGPTAEVDSVRWEADYKRQTVCQTGG